MHYSFIVAALTAVAFAKPLPHTGAIRRHNFYRRIHSAPAMSWDAGLASEAEAWVKQCNWSHHTDDYGQNLYMSSGEHPLSEAVDAWYSEEKDFAPYYGQADGLYSHFTQVVWKASTKLGCYTQQCETLVDPENPGSPMSGYFTACNYYEPGNYGGQFGENVFPPQGGS